MKLLSRMTDILGTRSHTLKKPSGRMGKQVFAAVLTIALLAGLQVNTTLAYYTDTSKASGSLPFLLTVNKDDPETPETPETPTDPDSDPDPETPVVTEESDGTNKIITVENTCTYPIYVRICAYASNEAVKIIPAAEAVEQNEATWKSEGETPVDDIQGGKAWVWYTGVLYSGDISRQLTLEVDASEVSSDSTFDVYVIMEYGMAVYQTDTQNLQLPGAKIAEDQDGDGKLDVVILNDLTLNPLKEAQPSRNRQSKELSTINISTVEITDGSTPLSPFAGFQDLNASHPEHDSIAELMQQFPKEMAGDMKSYYFHYMCKSQVSSTGSTEDINAFL